LAFAVRPPHCNLVAAMAHLLCRPGDCQALKGLAAAALSNISLDLVTDVQALSVSSTSLGPGTLRLRVTNGVTVSEPNAIAKLLGTTLNAQCRKSCCLCGPEPSNAEAAVLIHSWLEWDVSTLQPATLLSVGSQQAPALAAALNHLTSCLSSSHRLHLTARTPLLVPHCLSACLLTCCSTSGQLLADVGAPALTTVFEQDAAQYQAAQPRLPQPGKRNILITSALPYVNNVPHLGNIIGCVLSADVYARFCRARGYNTVYVCGTDEYGTATETKRHVLAPAAAHGVRQALEEGLSCAELCDKYHAVHKAIYEWFDIGFDKWVPHRQPGARLPRLGAGSCTGASPFPAPALRRFGRTPSRAQTSICQAVFAELQAQGCLLEQSMEQLFRPLVLVVLVVLLVLAFAVRPPHCNLVAAMAHLLCRPGDCQALKGLAAAALSNISLDLVTDVQALSVSSTSLGPGTLRLRVTNGVTVSEPNAIAKLLGPEPSNAEAAVLIHSWLEWDVSTLQPATLLSVGSQQAPALAAALNHLTSCLSSSSGPWLLGEQLSVADVVVYSTLLPLLLHPNPAADLAAQHSTAHTYLTRVGASDAVRSAQEKLLADVGAPALTTVFEQDAAQYQAAQPRLPQPGKRNILITSALPYVNNVPHLGNIIGCVLSADVYARFCRARGYNTVYVCGTDEYGTATETKRHVLAPAAAHGVRQALEEGLSCAELCDKYHAVHKAIYEWFDIGFDKFGRTPSRAQTSICQAVFAELQAQGCLLEQSMEQLFSEALGKFLADRFVTGTCPKCKYEVSTRHGDTGGHRAVQGKPGLWSSLMRPGSEQPLCLPSQTSRQPGTLPEGQGSGVGKAQGCKGGKDDCGADGGDGTAAKRRHVQDARGDQCDQCGTLLNPTELLRPKCKITGTTPVIRSTRHIFLDLPKLSPPLQTYITNTSAQGGWSNNCVQVALVKGVLWVGACLLTSLFEPTAPAARTLTQVTSAWMRDGLKPRCITRDLKWGTPVPQPGFDTKVFYVWFDAPIGYISITANYTAEWEQWWKNPKDVELVQFMGKDNVPFHTVIFPATLLGTGGPWTMMRNISVTEYLNYEGGKFSKSRGTGETHAVPSTAHRTASSRGSSTSTSLHHAALSMGFLQGLGVKGGEMPQPSTLPLLDATLQEASAQQLGMGVFGNDAQDTGIPVEVWRYYLLSVRPEQQDTDFKWSDLQARTNSELLANLGNLVNRALQFVVKFFNGVVPAAHPEKGAQALAALGATVGPKVAEYYAAMEAIKLREGIRLAMTISADGNKFIQDNQPWVLMKQDIEHCGSIVAGGNEHPSATGMNLTCSAAFPCAAVGMVRLVTALVAPYMPSFTKSVLAQMALPPSASDLTDALAAGAFNPQVLAPPAGHVIGKPAPLVTAIPDDLVESLRERFGGSQSERQAKQTAPASAPVLPAKPTPREAAKKATSASTTSTAGTVATEAL
ncbi:hypothetical protein QJQ45_014926, partial [Haematococcus lacustris]